MRKYIVGLVTIILMALGFNLNSAWAQPLPIQSRDDLRQFALTSVVRGGRSVDCPSMVWNDPGMLVHTEQVGTSAEEVLDKLFNVELHFKVSNPTDKVNGWVWLNDSKGRLLFYGHTDYLANQMEKGFKPQYNIWMQNTPILEGVESAEVLILNEDGITTRRERLKVEQGGALFPEGMSGAMNGILAVRFTDGTVRTWNLWKPLGGTPGITTESADWKIDGHYNYNEVAGDTTVKVIETYLRPTVRLNVSKMCNVTFDILGIYYDDNGPAFERPLSMEVTYTALDGVQQETTVELSIDKPSTFGFGKFGEYRFRFNWINFGKPDRIYSGPSDGGGGGGGMGVVATPVGYTVTPVVTTEKAGTN